MVELRKNTRKNEGFTLIELLIVLAIIAILACIAIPVYNNVMDGAREKSDQSNISVLESAIELYALDYNGTYPAVSGTDAKEKFTSLVSILYNGNYIKQSTITASSSGKHFEYDDSKHTITLVAD